MANPYRDEILQLVRSNPHQFSYSDIAKRFNIEAEQVRGIARSNPDIFNLFIKTRSGGGIIRGRSSLTKESEVKKKPVSDKELSEVIKAERQARVAKEQGTISERKYKLAQKELDRMSAELEALTTIAEYKSQPFNINPKPNKKVSEATPFLVFSDWHVEERVDPRTIGGKNKYDLDVAKMRAEAVFQNGLKLIKEAENHSKVKDLALFLIGDFITGNIHEENMENALLGPVSAIHFAQDLLESGINFLLKNTNLNITCYCKVGNHSRITKKVRASTEADNSLETGMYVAMARNYRNEPRIRFCIEPSYYSIAVIQGVKVRYHHGHAIQYGGGVGGLHIPLRKAIKNWNENERADFDILGHYHSFLEHSTLKYMINGSLIGYNAYAERVKAILEPPVQGFGLFHSKYGVTSTLPLFAE